MQKLYVSKKVNSKKKNDLSKKEAQHPKTSNNENNLHKIVDEQDCGDDVHQIVLNGDVVNMEL